MNQLFLVGYMVDCYDLVEYRRQWLIIGSSLIDYVDSGFGYWYLVTALVII
jgi:hypothetical protein